MKNKIERKKRAFEIRNLAAEYATTDHTPDPLNNGDESKFSSDNYFANYSKGLPHNPDGEVDVFAYETLKTAVLTGNPETYNKIPLGTPGLGSNGLRGRFLTNPQAGWAFDLEGPDGQSLTIPPPPTFESAEVAAEMVELYWMALARDVYFEDYDTNPIIANAVNDLNNMTDYRGQGSSAGSIDYKNIFRGFTSGDLKGPYLSQFLLKDIPYGTLCISQKQKTARTGVDYITDFKTWLRVQNGENTGIDYNPCNNENHGGAFEVRRQYIRNLRDLATYVHYDALYEAYLNACLILLGMNAPLDSGNPYSYYDCSNPYHIQTLGSMSTNICNVNYHTPNQMGFGTFGGPHILSLVTEVATRALKAVWHQKWNVNRRLRPEAYGGRVHLKKTGSSVATKFNIHDDLLNSQALVETHNKFGSYLLPQAFAEGSPTHPAYGAGHATVAGACTTILKAWFDESHAIPDPQIASSNGLNLLSYSGKLTVGDELNKVAANVSIGRNAGGVHYWSDYKESLLLGEQIAISILKEQ
ncbi:MAG TPA: vanadium-dependent haloperoxidase, partial [Saprospiraceae bacterium]|nr:vanadium-dependent haloperoxidase [Saprospiraceae bacterium]